MHPLIRVFGLTMALTATSAMAQTPEATEPEGTAAMPVEPPAPATPEPEEPAPPAPEEPAPPTPEPERAEPPDGGPIPSEDRPSEPMSPEDDLAPTPPADDGPEMQVPLQIPVPPPPRAVEANPAMGRGNRFMDISTNLTELVTRDGPFAMRPGFGGVADQLVLRGATGAAGGDLTTTVDGIPIALPFSGRAVGFTDLEHIPVAAIDRFRTQPGPFDGSYAGSVALHTRHLSGVEGELLLSEHGHRRLSLAAGRPNMMVAVEHRRAQHETPGVTDERFSSLARASHQLADNLNIGLLLRGYSDVWDEPNTVPRDQPAATPEGDPTDGGKLWGLGAGILLGWTPSSRTRFDLSVSFLEDRWTRWHSNGGTQHEEKNRDRVWYGSARLQLEPRLALPTRISLGLDVGLDRTRARAFETDGRERNFQLEEINGDWLNIGGHGSAEIEFIDGFFVGAMARADQLTVRREHTARGEPDTRRDMLPSGALWLAYRLERFGAELQFGAGHRTAPDAMRGDNLSVDHYGSDLTLYGRVGLGEQWRLDWQASGFGSLYEASLFSETANGDERMVWGAEARIDVEHVPSGLMLVGRGGPWFSSLRGSVDREQLAAPGVPDYVVHAGLLRSAPSGLVAEVWVDAYGGYALTATTGGDQADSFIDVSARAGYRATWGTVWIGAMNLLDDEDALATAAPDRIVLRSRRAVYAQLEMRI